jgi:osmoprotectant transport system substrate-binding protein
VRRMLGIASLALLVFASACADDGTDSAGDESPKDGPTIVIGSADFTESIVLAEIYAQGLEAKGYEVDKKLNIGAREIYIPELEKGTIDLFPEYTGSLLSYLSSQKETPSPDSDKTYEAAQEQLGDKPITLLEYAPAQDKDGIVTNSETASDLDLEKISDLEEHAADLVFGGPPECRERQACLKGLADVYGIEFKEFKSLKPGQPVVQALKANEIQVANIFTTDSSIVANDFVLLEDDKGPIAGAENIVPAVLDEIIEAYGEGFEADVNAITAKITTEKLLELNGRVDIDKDDPDDVAGSFLRDNDLI